MEHTAQLFNDYGVERAHRYDAFYTTQDNPETDEPDHFGMFEIDEMTITDHKEQWVNFKRTVLTFSEDWDIGETVGYGLNSDGDPWFGMSPFEEFELAAGGSRPVETQSSFDYAEDYIGSPLTSYSYMRTPEDSYVLPIAFDISDTWAKWHEGQALVLRADIEVDESAEVALRYEAGGNRDFVYRAPLDNANQIVCEAFLAGIDTATSVPAYEIGVSEDYSDYGVPNNAIVSEPIQLYAGMNEINIAINDWTFQNGMAKRADISFVPTGNIPFVIHNIRLMPQAASDVTVEYFDASHCCPTKIDPPA